MGDDKDGMAGVSHLKISCLVRLNSLGIVDSLKRNGSPCLFLSISPSLSELGWCKIDENMVYHTCLND